MTADTLAVEVLIVDDEPAVVDALDRALVQEGYSVASAGDGRAALDRVATAPPDAVILDVSMPQMSGLEVCRRLRANGDRTPVLMLTARDEVDRPRRRPRRRRRRLPVEAVRARGAARAAARAAAADEARATTRACCASPTSSVDPTTYEARRGDRVIETTRTEYALLELLMQHPRQVLTRATIFERVWGYDFGYASNSLDVYIGYLRRKTEAGGEPRLIHTKRGIGYVLREP